MFAVWLTQVLESSSMCDVSILVNREHWAMEDLPRKWPHPVQVYRIPFFMPGTPLRRLTNSCLKNRRLRAGGELVADFFSLIFSPFIILYLAAFLRGKGIDQLYSHTGGWPSGQLGRWMLVAAWIAGIKKRVIVIHNYPMRRTGFFWGVLFRPIFWSQKLFVEAAATSIVTVSDSVKEVLERDVFTRKVSRIYNGIPLENKPVEGPEPAWRRTMPTVGFVGALYPLKGPHVLIEAFQQVEKKCELALLGPVDIEYGQFLQIEANKCKNKVTFLGYHSNVDSFLSKIDVLVVPSVAYESFGMVILEAMKHHKPVICSDFGGMKEIVVHGETGLVVPAADATKLAVAIQSLIDQPERMLAMGEAGYSRLVSSFSGKSMAQNYLALS